jgi:hypothetical protein
MALVIWTTPTETVFASDFSVEIHQKQANIPGRIVLGFEAVVALSKAEDVFKNLDAQAKDYGKIFLIIKGRYIIVSFLPKELAFDGGETIHVIINSSNMLVEGVSWQDRGIVPPKSIGDELKVELQ